MKIYLFVLSGVFLAGCSSRSVKTSLPPQDGRTPSGYSGSQKNPSSVPRFVEGSYGIRKVTVAPENEEYQKMRGRQGEAADWAAEEFCLASARVKTREYASRNLVKDGICMNEEDTISLQINRWAGGTYLYVVLDESPAEKDLTSWLLAPGADGDIRLTPPEKSDEEQIKLCSPVLHISEGGALSIKAPATAFQNVEKCTIQKHAPSFWDKNWGSRL